MRVMGRIWEGAAMAVAGVVAGAAWGFVLARLAGRYFQGMQMPGVLPVAVSAFLLLTVAVVASMLPAARAARVDVIQESTGGKEKTERANRKSKQKKRKTHLTHTGLLMEGTARRVTVGWVGQGYRQLQTRDQCCNTGPHARWHVYLRDRYVPELFPT